MAPAIRRHAEDVNRPSARYPTTEPPPSVRAAFHTAEVPVRFTAGRGQTWAAGAIVLKPIDDEAEAIWIAELAATLPQRGFRVARPIAARDGRWVVDGWTAWTRLAGAHSRTRLADLIEAASAFHAATSAAPKPEFIDRLGRVMASPLDRWRFGDRIAWGDAPLGDLSGVTHVEPLLQAWRQLELPSQLIHGDLVGNVLFADGLPPGIIDLSLYWRPVGYSAALVVGDAITWEGAPPETLRLLHNVAGWPQLLLRAVLFRVVVNELARRAKPSRGDVSEEYGPIVSLALGAVGRS